MPGSYVKKDAPICPECQSKTSFLTTGAYYCINCDLEFSPTHTGALNIYALTEDGDRQLLRMGQYRTSVAAQTFPSNTPIILSNREIGRASILKMVVDGILSTKKAARYMGVSVQWCRNLRNRFLSGGKTSLASGHRGRRPPNALPADVRIQIVTLASSAYAGYSLRQMQAALSVQGINLHYSTIDRILHGRMS